MKELFYEAYDSLEVKTFENYQEQLKYEKEKIIPKINAYFDEYYLKARLGKVQYPELFILLVVHLFRRIIDANKAEFEWSFIKELHDSETIIKDEKIVEKIIYMIGYTLAYSQVPLELEPLILQLEYAKDMVNQDNLDYLKWNLGIKKLEIKLAEKLQIALALLVFDEEKSGVSDEIIERYDKVIASLNKMIISGITYNDGNKNDKNEINEYQEDNHNIAKQMALLIIDYAVSYMVLDKDEVNLIYRTLMSLGGQAMVEEFTIKREKNRR